MAGRLTKKLMLLLADTLYDWAAFLANRAEAGDEASPHPAAEETLSPGMAKLEDLRNRGQEVRNGGPPAHWLALVRQHAPELLAPEDSRFTAIGGELPEDELPETEIAAVDGPWSTTRIELPRTDPQRLDHQLNQPRPPSPSIMVGRSSGSSGDLSPVSAKKNAPQMGFPEPAPGKQPSFLQTVSRPSPANLPWRDGPSGEPQTPPGSVRKESVLRDDSLVSSVRNRAETTEESKPYPPKPKPSEPASPVATETFSATPQRFSHKPVIKPRQAVEPDQGATRYAATALNSIPETEPVAGKTSFPIPGHRAISALKNYFFTAGGRTGKRSAQKTPATDKGAPPSAASHKPQKPPATVQPLRKSAGHEPMNPGSTNRPRDKVFSRRGSDPDTLQEEPWFRTAEPEVSVGAETKRTSSSSSEFNPQSVHQVFSQPAGWPSLPDEPETKIFPMVAQDRWPTLPANDADLIHQLLTEARATGAESAERIRRLDEEQRGLLWNG